MPVAATVFLVGAKAPSTIETKQMTTRNIRVVAPSDRDWPEHSEQLRAEVDALARQTAQMPKDQPINMRYDRSLWRAAYMTKQRAGFDTPEHLRSVDYAEYRPTSDTKLQAELRIPPAVTNGDPYQAVRRACKSDNEREVLKKAIEAGWTPNMLYMLAFSYKLFRTRRPGPAAYQLALWDIGRKGGIAEHLWQRYHPTEDQRPLSDSPAGPL